MAIMTSGRLGYVTYQTFNVMYHLCNVTKQCRVYNMLHNMYQNMLYNHKKCSSRYINNYNLYIPINITRYMRTNRMLYNKGGI